MPLQRPIARDWPTLDVKSLPQTERKAGHNLQGLLFHLAFYHHDFCAAVELFDHARLESGRAALMGKDSWAEDWRTIAARDGAMTIFNFGEALDAISFQELPTLRRQTDHDRLRQARKLMKTHFPNRVYIRHSVGHSAQMTRSVPEMEKHSVRGPYEIFTGAPLGDNRTLVNIRNSLRDRTFINTYEGKIFSYEISTETIKDLNEIRFMTYSAFLK